MPRVYLAGPPFAEEYRSRAAALAEQSGWEPVDPMRRDFRGRTEGREAEIVQGDLVDIDGCDAVLASFVTPDEGTAMEAWYAHSRGIPVVAYTGGEPAHPLTVYVAAAVHTALEDAVAALAGAGELVPRSRQTESTSETEPNDQ
jgi:nucleoside 2-deoxyribosyltransferase